MSSTSREVLIYCRSSSDEEDIGMGHVVRCGHLAKVLKDKGVAVHMLTNVTGNGHEYLRRQGLQVRDTWTEEAGDPGDYDFTTDTLIVDLQENDDDFLYRVRPVVNKLIVVVGAGKTITRRTHWIADMVVYQAPQMANQQKNIPGEHVLTGLKYVMINPFYAEVVLTDIKNRGVDILTYIGGGMPEGYVNERITWDSTKVHNYAASCWCDNLHTILPNAKLFVGTMGMIVYEAIACGIRSIVVGRSKDHVDVANKLCFMGVDCLGLAENIGPGELAKAANKALTKPSYKPRVHVDGFGAYRVAEEVLRL